MQETGVENTAALKALGEGGGGRERVQHRSLLAPCCWLGCFPDDEGLQSECVLALRSATQDSACILKIEPALGRVFGHRMVGRRLLLLLASSRADLTPPITHCLPHTLTTACGLGRGSDYRYSFNLPYTR